MSERPEDLDVRYLELALRELRPSTDHLDRAVLMYRAGQASARSWIWPAATLVSTALAFVLGLALWHRPPPQIVYVAAPSLRNDEASPSPPTHPLEDRTEPGGWSRYVDLQEQVFFHGLDGLPAPPSAPEGPPPDAESLFNSL